MKIYYDNKSFKWSHFNHHATITFGGENQLISPQIVNPSSSSICFDLHYKNGHVGPIIGIMTARKSNGTIAGNVSLFIKLQKKLISQNGISFIFTQDEILEHEIDGFIFIPEQNMWIKGKMPYPDLVYNRIPFRKSEQDKSFRDFILTLKEKKIPFFNPSFIDKLDLYHHFQAHPTLRTYMPQTEHIQTKDHLLTFLMKYQSVYLKPANSAKGKGIFRIRLNDGSEILLEGLTGSQIYSSFQEFWDHWHSTLLEGNYIVQEEILSALILGKRFDFRILAHAEKDSYTVTGVGIRQSQEQDLTTHIPNGGRLLPYHLIQSKEHDEFIKNVVDYTGKTLTQKFGYFGEFSIDATVSSTGKYYIFEVNSKPMAFDEAEIEERKIAQLCRLFLQLTGFE